MCVPLLAQEPQVTAKVETLDSRGMQVRILHSGLTKARNMMAIFKSFVEDIKESTARAVNPNPLKRQEGGEHYKGFEIQPAEFIFLNNIPYLEGCALKYICRHRLKGGIEDLMKAKHYIDIIMALEYKNQM